MANALKEVGTSRNVSLADGFVLLIHVRDICYVARIPLFDMSSTDQRIAPSEGASKR